MITEQESRHVKIINNGDEELYISEGTGGIYTVTRRQVLEQGHCAHPELSDEELLEEYRVVHWTWIVDTQPR